ncbi:hypothetical protein EAI_14099 [Harpegnathos saltator]|uniref:Uncharacterized protein n=1 Tax=Harpegnathos saltator TaxID=610380 RepID=E2BQW4_HARSA|nr:hypothetical protein EAI_14099 [Harpegnathos saltator]
MKLQEKIVFAQEKPLYDAIPLIIFDNAERKSSKVKEGDPRYNVASPICMTFRLLIFWILWATLIAAMVITVSAHFWFTARHSYRLDTHENANVTSR